MESEKKCNEKLPHILSAIAKHIVPFSPLLNHTPLILNTKGYSTDEMAFLKKKSSLSTELFQVFKQFGLNCVDSFILSSLFFQIISFHVRLESLEFTCSYFAYSHYPQFGD